MRTKQGSGNSLILAVIILVIIAMIGVLVWLFAANVFIKGHVYPRDTEYLNLRGKDLTVEEIQAIQKKLPDCELYWDVPFQGRTYPENTMSLTVTELSEEDVDAVGYFEHLEVVNAMGCTDYAQIMELKSRYPELTVGYVVTVCGIPYPSDAAEVALTALTEEEIRVLQYLPQLTAVDMGACGDYALLGTLMETYPHLSITVKLGNEKYTSDTTELTVTGMTDAEAASLAFFSNLKKLHLADPVMDAQTLLALPQTFPNVDITWEAEVLGVTVRSDDTELDLMGAISEDGVKAFEHAATDTVNGTRDDRVMLFAKRNKYPIEDLTAKTADMIEEVEAALAYFPDVEHVNMCGAFLDNEAMSDFREAHRADYKVVWSVDCGSMVVNTDTTYFMPYKYGVAYFFDEDTVNLRYCEDIVAIDLGHMSIHNADFVEYMPNLKYLILAHTQIADITPLQHCKSLLFLELDWSVVKDYTPLKGCTALEDLNLSKTYADIDPILEMSWLKHLWITDRGEETKLNLRKTFNPWVFEEKDEDRDDEAEQETRPEDLGTVLYLDGPSTVSGGWRQLPNYFAMREALNMEPMPG